MQIDPHLLINDHQSIISCIPYMTLAEYWLDYELITAAFVHIWANCGALDFSKLARKHFNCIRSEIPELAKNPKIIDIVGRSNQILHSISLK